MKRPSSPVGATLIVAGTTIGAGMLALPIIAHGLGFPLMSGLILLTWGLMAVAALLTLEVNLTIKPGCSLFIMATETLHARGCFLAVSSMLFLFYALLSAYIAGGGSQLAQYIPVLKTLPVRSDTAGMILFTLIFGSLASAGVHRVDICNRLLLLFMLAAFVVVLGLLSANIQLPRLITRPTDPWLGVAVLPVIFTSFGYHGSIPSLIAYVGPKREVLRRVFVIGSFFPLVIYLLWLATTLGQLGENELKVISQSGAIPDLVNALTSGDNPSLVTFILHIFTDLALVTSFLGVALGLFDFLHSAMASTSRLRTAFAVYLPPTVIAILLPGAFVIALSYAALALAVLSIILPVMMLQALKKQGRIESSTMSIMTFPTLLFGISICLLSLIYS